MMYLLGCFIAFIFLFGCQKENRSLEIYPIHRRDDEMLLPSTIPVPTNIKVSYPWDQKRTGGFLPITKESFRCKGSPLHPILKIDGQKEQIYLLDCRGFEEHTLPIRHGKEFIYPQLIQMLNGLQEALHKKVVVTSGHRCPVHQRYVTKKYDLEGSKHLIGGAVTFYLEGSEINADEIVSILLACSPTLDVVCSSADTGETSWSTKEWKLTYFIPDAGRNVDNDHSYSYFYLELFYDSILKSAVSFNWYRAHYGFEQIHSNVQYAR